MGAPVDIALYWKSVGARKRTSNWRPWLSVVEIAAYHGVKRDTVYKWIERKAMPVHKVGRLWKFRRHEVDKWITTVEGGRSPQAEDDV